MAEDGLTQLEELEAKIGYSFDNRSLLRAAMTHVSYTNEQSGDPSAHNERLEFLGDAVITLVISELLFLRDPAPEGVLTRAKNNLVNAASLAELGSALALGEYLLLGRGEELSGGRERKSNLCNAFEALVGALYLDAGFVVTRRFISRQFATMLSGVLQQKTSSIEYKSEFQEQVQSSGKPAPRYRIIAESGPDHEKLFTAEVSVAGSPVATGSGPSKQAAEQDAARQALKLPGDVD